MSDMLFFEKKAKESSYNRVAGIDEAGRGPLAGPVVAAACILPLNIESDISGINDSKKLSPKKREKIFEELHEHPEVFLGIGIVSAEIIDSINILQATIQAMLLAVENLTVQADYLLVDGLYLPHPHLPVEKIIKGDSLSFSIAAASIVAKVTRDRILIEMDKKWPEYAFAKHKAYGTLIHREALKKYGPCPEHRKSFAPVRESLLSFAL